MGMTDRSEEVEQLEVVLEQTGEDRDRWRERAKAAEAQLAGLREACRGWAEKSQSVILDLLSIAREIQDPVLRERIWKAGDGLTQVRTQVGLAALDAARKPKFKPWSEYPIGTKAFSSIGGYWTKTRKGWKAWVGDTFTTPGGDVFSVEEPAALDAAATQSGAATPEPVGSGAPGSRPSYAMLVEKLQACAQTAHHYRRFTGTCDQVPFEQCANPFCMSMRDTISAAKKG